MKSNRRLVQFKIENPSGTPTVPAPAVDAFQAINFKWDSAAKPVTDEFTYAAGHYGAGDTFTVSLMRECSFEQPLMGGGAPLGTNYPPALLALYRACGHAAVETATTSVVFNPISDAMESGTLLVHDDTFLRRMAYVRGNMRWVLAEGKVPRAMVSLMGTYNTPSDQVMPVATLPVLQKPVGFNKSNSTVTLGGLVLKCSSAEVDAGRVNEYRNFAGAEDVVPSDAKSIATLKFELPRVDQKNLYQELEQNTVQALLVNHGQTVGNRVAIAAPAAQLTGLTEEEDRGVLFVTASFRLKPVTGNDQYTITLT